ncbi:hypothetical protein NFI96_027581 [Prochilodus magdalenae]|nr:hypothetical protein NFI96_027581 [Prochilodus magdalenae]
MLEANVSSPVFVPVCSHELLHRMTGKGLAAQYHFPRQPCIYGDRMVSVQLTFSNHGDHALEDIHISEKTSTGQNIHCFRPIECLEPEASVTVSVGVDFNDSTQAASFQLCLAVGEVVGYNSIVSASRMSGAVVVFLDDVEKVNMMVQNGVVVQGTLTPVTPLIRPARKITLSNVPPFIKDELITAELARRQVYVVLKNGIDEVNVAFKFRIDDFDYVVFATSDSMRCFGCGQEGHLRRSCPEKVEERPLQALNSGPTENDAGQVSGTEAGPSTAGEWAADPRADSRADTDPDIQTQEEEGGGAARPDTETRSVTAVGQECSESESDGASADVGAGAVFAAVGSVLEEEDMDMDAVAEKNVFKAPSGKRKIKWTKPGDSKGKTQRVAGVRGEKQGEDTGLSAPDDSDGDLSDVKSQRSRRSAYTFGKIQSFLQRTKNMKGVVVEDYFPDRRLFIESVQAIMKNDGGEQFTLEDEILGLQRLIDSTGDQSHTADLKSKKSALTNLLGFRAQGALVRSRYQSLTQMDAPSRFFFSLERKNGQSRFIHSLRTANGQELTEPVGIRKWAVQFYSELYRSERKEDRELAAGFYAGLPRVPEQLNAELERPLGEQELHAALQSMEGGTAPGIDGLPVEFYKAFWAELSADLLAVLNEAVAEGSLPLSCRRAVVTLLPKKGDLQNIKNWRPVSLLCTDLKVFSKALAIRMREAMGHVIHLDQTYCVPGRSITDNISLVRDVLEVSSILGVDSGLISLDQEKAFDRVEHQYLWNTLEAFGFSPSFSAMVKVLYRDVESVLKINGGLSAPFKVERGIRQGCAMSGMLYCFAIEPLLNKLRSKIEGFVLPQYGVQHRLSAYADDVMIMVNGQLDVDNLVAAIRDFGKISSAKTEATRQRNWDGVVEKMEGRLARWKWIRPQMSLRGRVLVINNLAASVLWHRLSCVDPPVGLLARLQAIMVDFFWDRLHWVAQGVLFQAKEEGGQGLVHLASRLATFRVQFIIKFLTGPVDLVWRKVASVILQKADGLRLDTALFLMDCKQLHLSGLPPFYRGLFKCWALFKTNRLRPSTSLFWLLEEPLLKGSRLDVVSGVPGLTQTLCKANMVKLQHLVDTAGPGLGDAQTVASFLGQRSVRQISTVLDLWAKRLDREDWSLLQDYLSGSAVPNRGDPFPNTGLTPDFTDMSGPLLDLNGLRDINLGTASDRAVCKDSDLSPSALPTDLIRNTKTERFSVSIQPTVGELLLPVTMTEQDFNREQGTAFFHVPSSPEREAVRSSGGIRVSLDGGWLCSSVRVIRSSPGMPKSGTGKLLGMNESSATINMPPETVSSQPVSKKVVSVANVGVVPSGQDNVHSSVDNTTTGQGATTTWVRIPVWVTTLSYTNKSPWARLLTLRWPTCNMINLCYKSQVPEGYIDVTSVTRPFSKVKAGPFAAKLVSSGGLVLVCVVQKDSSAQLTVNTERTVVGSMLLRELQTTLGAP